MSVINEDLRKKSVQAWEQIAWSPERTKNMFRDWGIYLTRCHRHSDALEFYEKAHEMDNQDGKTIFFRSQCNRFVNAKPFEHFEEHLSLAGKSVSRVQVDLERAASFYDSNQIEATTVNLHRDIEKYKGAQKTPFLERIDILHENLNDSLGDSLGPFILKNEHVFPRVIEEQRIKNTVDNRPLWKILKEQQKCDILSVPEREFIELSPLEIARRERSLRVMNQIYFNRAWKDVIFLKDLQSHPNYLLPNWKMSAPILKKLLCHSNETNKRYLKMLEVRSPLYNENNRRCPNPKLTEEHRQKYLFNVQYQTRRNMIIILRNVQALRQMGKTDVLSKYIENVMGEYVVLKTYRTFPWKFEFINEIYNALALAIADTFVIPKNFKNIKTIHQIYVLLQLPEIKHLTPPQPVFGDKKTFQNLDVKGNFAKNSHKEFLEQMHKRIKFAKYSIEIAYLLYQIAQNYFKQNHFSACVLYAKKAIKQADNCNSNIWKFINIMLIVKSYAIQRKVEYLEEALIDARAVADKLKSKKIKSFINLCQNVNDEDITLRKQKQSKESLTPKSKRLRKSSAFSLYSSRSSDVTMLSQYIS